MFPSSKKNNKGGSGFADNPEPSSPKVTCIGQVRVKTKKQGKKMKMRACRSKRLSGGGGSGGEASFRRIEQAQPIQGLQNQQTPQECGGLNHRNQRWVHLPLTICEALRAFGSEFSCLFPCKSSCFNSGSFCGGGDKSGKTMEERENSSPSSCAVFRWLVSLQEGEGEGEGKRRDIELVVGGEEEEERESRMVMERECSRRRSIFDDMEFDDLFTNVKNNGSSEIHNNVNNGGDDDVVDDDDEDGRVSICIPPKNALLLMRCRSDPMKMASLSRKLWEVPLPPQDDCIPVEDDVVQDQQVLEVVELEDKTEDRQDLGEGNESVQEMLDDLVAVEEHKETEEKQCTGISEEEDTCQVLEDDIVANGCSIKTLFEEDKVEDLVIKPEECEAVKVDEEEEEEERESAELVLESDDNLSTVEQVKAVEERESAELVLESDDLSTVHEEEEERVRGGVESSDLSTNSSSSMNSSEESTAESKEREEEEEHHEKEAVEVVEEKPVQEEEEGGGRKSMDRENKNKPTLPDCLLLMMCEPKVSMEVSKETWVCSTDFIRWLPERHHKKALNKTDASGDSTKKNKPAAVAAIPPQTVQQPSGQRCEQAAQPARSSISFPAGGGSVANLIEQKLVKAGGYEPFVLTRCKSAPMRSAAKIAPPELACSLWGREKRKLEPHRPATFGVGAAGVGF